MNRRRSLVAVALATGAAAGAWVVGSKPDVPNLPAERRGELVYLAMPPGVPSSGVLVGIGATPPALTASLALLEDEATAPTRGNGSAVVVAFSDYRCGPCRASAADWRRRAQRNEVRLVMREWPILGPPSTLAARAALAAARQDGYWRMHDALMATGFIPTMALVLDLARRQDLDVAKLEADLRDPSIDRALERNTTLARAIGASGTPTYVVDGVVVAAGFAPSTVLALGVRHAAA